MSLVSAKADKSADSSVALVVEHTRQGILADIYPADSKIHPKLIAERCGTSFIPVREALRILEAEGFIVFRHNRGAWVTPLTLADLHDIYKLRIQNQHSAQEAASRLGNLLANPYVLDSGHCSRVHCWD